MRRAAPSKERRFLHRLEIGLAGGFAAGAAIGALTGAVLGAIFLGTGSLGMWLALVAGLVAGSGLGTFLGGMATLDVPPPGHEPSDRDVPGSDRATTEREAEDLWRVERR